MKKRICDVPVGTVFKLRRTGETYLKAGGNGDILSLDGMEHHIHALSGVEVLRMATPEEWIDIRAKRGPWKPNAKPAVVTPPRRGPYKLKSAEPSEEMLKKFQTAMAVLTDEIATLRMENDSLKRILLVVSKLLPINGETK